MGTLIERNAIDGFKVYGLQQVDYTVAGIANQDYTRAVQAAALKESEAIEQETEAYMAILQARQQKLQDLGEALSTLTKAIASMKAKSQSSNDNSAKMGTELRRAQNILTKYGVSPNFGITDDKVKRGEAMKSQSAVQYAMDTENNDLQQDMITTQGLVSKRDNAFSTASSLVSKVNNTGKQILQNMLNQ